MSRRRLIVMDNAASGPWRPLGHAQPPPPLPRGFAPPRFTPQHQAENPDQPMTRLVKDVIRLGRWKTGTDAMGRPEMWDVTPLELSELAFAHMRSAGRGVAMNLTKSHGNLATGIVPTDELICPIDEMIVSNGVLWVSCYVTPEQARYLMNPACKVSPGVWPDWSDGLGNRYPLRMLHVAVTDNPVIPGQGPFLALANSSNRRKTTMDFQLLKGLINDLLGAIDRDGMVATLPTDTDETSLCRDLQIICDSLGIKNSAMQDQQQAYDQANVLGTGGIPGFGMANRTRKGSRGRVMFNPNRPGRPSDAQCRSAATKFYGAEPPRGGK